MVDDKQSTINKMKSVKNKIQTLIETGKLKEAQEFLNEYEKAVPDDIDIYSMRAIIAIMEGKLSDAEQILLKGIAIDNTNFDLIYNLGFLYESQEKYERSYEYYKKSINYCNDTNLKDEIEQKIITLQETYDIKGYKKKPKIVFFSKGDDKFIWDIIVELSKEYEIKKVTIKSSEEFILIDQWMQWADVCWFEWCDELVIYGSKLEISKEKKIICRLHRYEALTEHPKNVNWCNIDKLIIVTDHLKSFLKAQIPNIEEKVEIVTINNGVNLNKYRFEKRNKGFNLAYVGYIHQRKNPVLLLQLMQKLVERDKRYKLYIAGQFQDPLIKLYWDYQIDKMNLGENIIYEGWQDDIHIWLKDKNYLISTSIHESFGYGIAEAMARGIKPIIHDFVFAEEIWNKKYLFNTMDEAIEMIMDKSYDSREYRRFIEENYSLEKQIHKIGEMLRSLESHQKPQDKDEKRLMKIYQIIEDVYSGRFRFESKNKVIEETTLVIPTFNRANMLHRDMEYGLKFGDIAKIIVDDGSNQTNKKVLNDILIKGKEFNINNILTFDKNRGVACARRKGIDNVKTDTMMFLGDDDCLISLDNNCEISKYIDKIGDDPIVIIPRYVFNLYGDGKIRIGYDRKQFNDMLVEDILRQFALTGEILAFSAGAIYNTQQLKPNIADGFFRIGEDHVMLARLFANNIGKRVKVLESYFHIRRIDPGTLSGSKSKEKIFIDLIALLVSSFYCLKNDIIDKQTFLCAFSNRIKLFQSLYGIGNEIGVIIKRYLNKTIDLNVFTQEIVEEGITDNLTGKDLPKEFNEIIRYL